MTTVQIGHDRGITETAGEVREFTPPERAALDKARAERGYGVGDRVEVSWRQKWRPATVRSVTVWRGYTTGVTAHIDGHQSARQSPPENVRPVKVVA